MNNTVIGFFLFALASASTTAMGTEENCDPVDREASISKVLDSHAGGKVLKVDERTDDDGCVELEIRILIDGTVKAIIVPSQKSA